MIREIISSDIYVVCSITSLLLVLITKTLYKRHFLDFLSYLGNSNYLKIYLNQNKFFTLFNLILFLNLCLNCVAFMYIYSSELEINLIISIKSFLILFGLIGFYLVGKICIKLFLGYVFNIDKQMSILIFQQISSLNFIGLILLPINSILVFTFKFDSVAINTSIVVVISVVVFGMIKTIQSNLKLILANFLYFILYICTLEIGPYILFYDYLNVTDYL